MRPPLPSDKSNVNARLNGSCSRRGDNLEQTPETNEKKIEALIEIICRAGDEPETKSAALLVLMATVENCSHPKALANTAKHFAFTRCGELNVYNMVDVQIAIAEGELFADNAMVS